MKISEIGEFGLIDTIDRLVSDYQSQRPANPRLLIGIGDDAAAWRVPDEIQLATVDTMVEGVHFTMDTITYRQLGWKAMAMNISDIVAMAGVPDYALVALTLPGGMTVKNVTDLYEGMMDIAGTYGLTIAGGNISRSESFSITITVLGSGREDVLLKRSNARAGDVIAVTGFPGCAAGGLEMLTRKLSFSAEINRHLHIAFLQPFPRMVEAQTIVKNGIKAAIDISDGLVSDLEHVCRASKVGATINIETLPIDPLGREAFGDHALDLALTGGEGYELLFTGPKKKVQAAIREITMPVTIIGEITADNPGSVILVDNSGKPVTRESAGWRHF